MSSSYSAVGIPVCEGALWALRSVLFAMCFVLPVSALPANSGAEVMGSGDGRIHVIPSLHPYSIKNGESLSISALVRSERPVASVTADLGGVAEVELAVNERSGTGMLPAGGHAAVYEAEWVGHDLEEKIYSVALTITDVDGRSWTDRSLSFSDPAAGHSTPGTTDYPEGGMATLNNFGLKEGENNVWSAAIDRENGYAYFGTDTIPGYVVKVALGDGGAPPTHVGTLELSEQDALLSSAVIDVAGGHAYFGSRLHWGRVIKVALGEGDDPPTHVASLVLDSSNGGPLRSAVIDVENGYAYFGTGGSSRRVVKVALGEGSAAPTLVGSRLLATGETQLRSAVIDTENGYAYFGTWTSPARVVKVALGEGNALPTRIGALTLDEGENQIQTGVIDAENGYAYFGTSEGFSDPGRIVKVALGEGNALPSRVDALTLEEGEGALRCAVIDPTAGYAYFGTGTGSARLVKVSLGEGGAAPSRVGALDNPPANNFGAGVIDAADGFAYFGTLSTPGRVVKVELGVGDDAPATAGTAAFWPGENVVQCGVIDAANGYAYFGTMTEPGQVVKVALGEAGHPATRVGSLSLEEGEDRLRSAVIDVENGYAYFGTGESGVPGRVVKVALGEGDALPERVDAVTLDADETVLSSAVIDTEEGYAYFGTETLPGRVVKVALGEGDDAPERVDAVTLPGGMNRLTSGVIDAADGHAYFGTDTFPGYVAKIALGEGSAAPSHVGTVMLDSGENALHSAVIDTENGYAYFGTHQVSVPGRVVKIALGEFPSRVDAVTLEGPEERLGSAAIDTANGIAYFTRSAEPVWVTAVALGEGDAAPARIGSTRILPAGGFRSTLIDTESRELYLGGGAFPGRVVKVTLSQAGFLKGTRFTLPEYATVEDVRFHSHAATGTLRLALYQGAYPVGQLIWESDETANTAENEDLVVPVSAGTPSTLQLVPGTYWAAWQSDSTASVASYTEGSPGDGFRYAQPFGPAPPAMISGDFVETSDVWTQYITYTANEATTATIGSIVSPTSGTVFVDIPVEFGEDVSGLSVDDFDTTGTVVSNLQGSGASYTIDVTLTGADGVKELRLPADSAFDWAGQGNLESNLVSVLLDTMPPVTTIEGPGAVIGGDITGTYTAGDGEGTGVAWVRLYVKEPDGVWTDGGLLSGGTWSHTPTQAGEAAAGKYEFSLVAEDNFGHRTAVPSGDDPGQAVVVYGLEEIVEFVVVFEEDGIIIRPMSDGVYIEIELSGSTGPTTVTVTRTVGNLSPNPSFDPDKLINEYLTITGDLNGAIATLRWRFDWASAAGLATPHNAVFQFSGSTQVNEFPVTPGANPVVVGGITSFSTWWIGNNDATVEGWRVLDD